MSSVTFLVSAVLTVCVLHAFDQKDISSSIDKIDFNSQAQIELDKPEKANAELIKPSQAQTSAPSVNVYGVKKNENVLPISQNSTKNIVLKSSSAI